ncbi:MAG: hypothetical protein R2912_11940 [Eubacteriales bacterium]
MFAPVRVSPPFFGWVFQFGGRVRILAPDDVRERMLLMLEDPRANHRRIEYNRKKTLEDDACFISYSLNRECPKHRQYCRNYARACKLHLVRPQAFVDDRQLNDADWLLMEHELNHLSRRAADRRHIPMGGSFCSRRTRKKTMPGDIYERRIFRLLARAGLGPALLARRGEDAVRIPMR